MKVRERVAHLHLIIIIAIVTFNYDIKLMSGERDVILANKNNIM